MPATEPSTPEKSYRLAISGSRDFPDGAMHHVANFVNSIPEHVTVVVGDARGVDKYATACARRRGLSVEVFSAKWDELGNRAGIVRNEAMLRTASSLVAFWDMTSRGTAHAISFARNRRIPVRVYAPNGTRLDPARVLRCGKYARAVTKIEHIDEGTHEREVRSTLGKGGRGASRRAARSFQRRNRY